MDFIELLKDADAPIQWLVIILIFVRLDMRLGQLMEWNHQEMIKLFDIHATVRTGKPGATRQHDMSADGGSLYAAPSDDDTSRDGDAEHLS